MKIVKNMLVGVLLIGLIFNANVIQASAAVIDGQINMTADEAINWVGQQAGKQLGTPYNGQYQCVGLTYVYMYGCLGITNPYGGNAIDYSNVNNAPYGITPIQGATPQKGDIIIYTDNSYGHVAIYADNNTTYHQNYNYKNYVSQEGNYMMTKYGNQSYWGVWRPNFITNQFPIGDINEVSSINDTIYVRGWAFDPDEPSKAIDVHVYVGKPARQGENATYAGTANLVRTDVNTAYGIGGNHGFEFEFAVPLRGNQPVYLYAIDTEGGHNPEFANTTVNIVGDTTKPVISSATITSYDKDGYTITATASDNVGVVSMKFPTWITGDSTDGIAWPEGARVSNGTFTYRVNVSAFQNRGGNYCTDVYAYDAAGNESGYSRVQINIDRTPPNISSVSIEPISESSYKATCQIADVNALSQVKYGISVNGKPSIWRDAIFVNGYYETIVNASDFSDEYGEYLTTIRAIDSYGNESTSISSITILEKMDKPLTQIEVNKESMTIQSGSTETLSVTYTPEDTTDDKEVTWTSGDETIATVDDNGVVIAQSAGTTTITAAVGNCSDSCTVTVEAVNEGDDEEDDPIDKPLTQIEINKESMTIQSGGTETLSVIYTPEDTTDDKEVTWTSGDETIATVDNNGVVTAQSAGTTTITATVGNCSDSCTVTVEADYEGEDKGNTDTSAGGVEVANYHYRQEEKEEEPKENEEQIFTRELLESVEKLQIGDTKVIDATCWHSFSANVLKELLSKEGVSYKFYYNYGGEYFYITIPAGSVLEEGTNWYGPLKLNAMFGRTMIDKRELIAALDK